MRFDVRGVDHLCLSRAASARQFLKHPLPHSPFCPAHKAIVDRRWGTVLGRAIAPAASTLKYVQYATDHPPIIHPGLAAHVGRQQRRDLRPLFVGQPKQIAAHGLLPNAQGQRIVVKVIRQQDYWVFTLALASLKHPLELACEMAMMR